MKKRMPTSAPRIGFDRFIRSEWADCALNIRRGVEDISELDRLFDRAKLGAAARVKTMTVLKKLWLRPSPSLKELADRCSTAAKHTPQDMLPLHWVMAVSSYPFFGKVAELFGKLSSIQGDCAPAELHRRMSEIYGEREGTYRMTNMVVQTHADWRTMRRTKKRLERSDALRVDNSELAALLVEAAVRYHGKSLPSSAIFALPILYPFKVSTRIANLASRSDKLELRSNSRGEPMLTIRAESSQ